MGFNKCHLPDIQDLINLYNEIGLENFLKQFSRYDAMTGSTDSFKFLDEKKKNYELQQISLVDKGEKNENTTS